MMVVDIAAVGDSILCHTIVVSVVSRSFVCFLAEE